jgi:spore coat polysaccharide biosynthesis protein SpsF
MKTVIIVQARMTSTRLPGKVMLPLAGHPMLERLIERLNRVSRADAVVIATTTNATDDVIAACCVAQGVACHRGPEHDVLSRYAGAAREHQASMVVRVTSDCPLLDPELVDDLLQRFTSAGAQVDYLSNMLEPTWPYGMAVEVFSAQALYEAEAEATLPAEREHVTPFIYWRPERYRLLSVRHDVDLSRQRWTVDTPEDYELVRRIFEALYPVRPCFAMADVLGLLARHQDWMQINQHIEQKRAEPETTKDAP